MVKTEAVLLSEVGSEGMPVGEGKAELTSGVGVGDSIDTLELPTSPGVTDSTGASLPEEEPLARLVEVAETLDMDDREAVSSADKPIPDILEDGSSSTKDEEVGDGVVIRVEISEDSVGLSEAGTVEEAKSPIWEDGEGVSDVLDTEEDIAEVDSVVVGASSSCEDEELRIAEVEDGSAGVIIEGPSS
jgi:hypothetical protein